MTTGRYPVRSRRNTTDRPVLTAALGIWALLLGMLMLMLGNGLQGTVIGVRATAEGFATNTTGLIISGYFIGFLLGSWLTPKFIQQVGHLRVFAAFASVASVTVLVHSMVIAPWVWVLMRLVTGFAFAGVYIVAESWLNDRVTNEHRGGLLSIYMIISYAGLTGGQLLLNSSFWSRCWYRWPPCRSCWW
jgi:MFS family permease